MEIWPECMGPDNSGPATGTVIWGGTLTVFRRIHRSGTLWTDVECGRAMPTQMTAVVNPASERNRPVYMVSELACVPADQVVAAVTAPSVGLIDIEALLSRLLRTAPEQAPPSQDSTAASAFGNADSDIAVYGGTTAYDDTAAYGETDTNPNPVIPRRD